MQSTCLIIDNLYKLFEILISKPSQKTDHRLLKTAVLIFLLWFITGVSTSLLAQNNNYSNLKWHQLTELKDSILREQFSIIPSSIRFISDHSENPSYSLENNLLRVNSEQAWSGIITYRVFDFNLILSDPILNPADIQRDERIMLLSPKEMNTAFSRSLLDSGELDYRGSFTRGISMGNSQDLVLNSSLNLQLNGDLGDGLYITAAISDENIPIQPEGNTQILQEFNKVFIEIKKHRTSIIAGDYELQGSNSYFMRYFKKLKGFSFNTSKNLNENITLENKASFAISRGKFQRVQLQTMEGNQGPYKLEGANRELFIQVLSGTEKIYADGRLLTRGENNDYIIDYNRAEIVFTPRLIITANLRIIAEYEYTVQTYIRSLFATETKVQGKNWNVSLNSYSEQDSKSLNGNNSLDTSELRILREGGDSQVFRSGIFSLDSLSLSSTVPYRLNKGVLEYAPMDSMNIFGARFSDLGRSSGDYIIDQQIGANGRVYKYVGAGLGNFSPLVQLIAPEQKQLFSTSAEFSFRDSSYIYAEAALSHTDINRVSELDDMDNIGTAFKTGVKDSRSIAGLTRFELESYADYEFTHQNFRALNPFREAEFNRDWNLSRNFNAGEQHILSSGFKLQSSALTLNYDIQNFRDLHQYSGVRHQPALSLTTADWLIHLKGNWLDAKMNESRIHFSRPRMNIEKSFLDKSLKLGLYYEKEKSIIHSTSDSLSRESFNYDHIRLYAERIVDQSLKIYTSYSVRLDDRLVNTSLEKVTESHDLEFGGFWNRGSVSELNWQFMLRDYKVLDNYLDSDNPRKSIIGNLSHQLSLVKNAIQLSSFYESNSGQEPKIEFQFVKVQNGEGSLIWNDYNLDGIEQINEFETAPFSDLAAYEKISVFNNEFISSNRYVLNQSLKLDVRKLFPNSGFLKRLFFISRYRIDQKQQSEDDKLLKTINFDLDSEDLVSFNASFDHNIFFNRGNPAWDLQFSHRKLNNKILQISGFEQRKNSNYIVRLRLNLHRQLDMILESAFGNTVRESENFSDQNFDLQTFELSPQINYRPGHKFRSILKIKYSSKSNQKQPEIENARLWDGGIELSWRQSQRDNLECRLNFVHIEYNGNRNSPLGFEILQGLNQGNNFLASLSYVRRVSQSIDIIMDYNIRKSESRAAINTATIQMRAIF